MPCSSLIMYTGIYSSDTTTFKNGQGVLSQPEMSGGCGYILYILALNHLEELARMEGRKLVLLFWSTVLLASITSASSTSSWKLFIPSTPAPAPAPGPKPSSNSIKGGYWPSSLAEIFPPSMISTQYFSHLFYAFLTMDASTHGLLVTQADELLMKNFTGTLHAKSPRAIVFLSIGGDAADSSAFSGMAGNATSLAAFIKSTIEVARKYDFDGLDLDWEFPITPEDMSNLALLFQDWSISLAAESLVSSKPRLFLAAAVYFASSFFLTNPKVVYPVDAITKYVDFVSPMCFNYHGSWDTSVTGEHALLYDNSSNLSTSYGILSWIEEGVPPEKLVMGLPMYGKTWKLQDPSVHGIKAPAVGVGPGNGTMFYTDIVDYNTNHGAEEVYDNDTVSTYSYSGTDWIGYDSERSIEGKVKFAKDHYLGGYFFWSIGKDKNWGLSRAASSTWDKYN